MLDQNYKGVIIEESLEDKSVLDLVKILGTRVEEVTEKHQTPWLEKWTLHDVLVNPEQAEEVANKISKDLDCEHEWYADFKNKDSHYIIFKNKVFKIDRKSKEEYHHATLYGISLGIPDYQVNFSSFLNGGED